MNLIVDDGSSTKLDVSYTHFVLLFGFRSVANIEDYKGKSKVKKDVQVKGRGGKEGKMGLRGGDEKIVNEDIKKVEITKIVVYMENDEIIKIYYILFSYI